MLTGNESEQEFKKIKETVTRLIDDAWDYFDEEEEVTQ